MADVINLRRARKARDRAEAAATAAQNRVRHGRTRAERATSDAEAQRLTRIVDGARIAPEAD